MRWYPIQNGPAVPWSLMERHREQLKKNHDQTLEGLAGRGGLSMYEALCAIEGRKLYDKEMERLSDEEIYRRLETHVARDMTAERDRLREQLVVAVRALKPFAEMAEGKDSWPATHNCAQFPTMPQVRAARDALDQINQDK